MHQTVRVSARLPLAQPGTGELAPGFWHEGARDGQAGAGWMLGEGAEPLAQGGRACVIVLGMHRSGTSAMARLVSLLGCALPATLMPGRAGNEGGHWESEAICALNDALLARMGSDWRGLDGARVALDEDWLARGGAVLREEFGAAPLFVMKDPRQCRLLPFWLEVLAREGVGARVVMMLRHPWEVAQSLMRRDGMGAGRAQLLWLHHMLAGEAESRGRPRAVCLYDRVMAGGEDALGDLAYDLGGALGVDWPQMGPPVLGEMAAFVDPAARHHVAGQQALSGWAGRVFAILSRWAAQGEDADDHAELDAIAGAMAQAGPELARLVEESEALAAAVATAQADLVGARGGLAGAVEWLAEERAGRECARAALARREEDLLELATLRDALLAERVALIAQGEADRREAEADRREAEGALARQAGESAAAIARLRREAGATVVALDTALLRLGQREGDVTRMGREQARLAARLEEAESWVLRLARARHGLEREAAREARRIEAVERDLARERARGGDLAALRAALATALAEREHQDALVAGLEQRLARALGAREEIDGLLVRERAASDEARALAEQEQSRAGQARAQTEQARARAEEELAARYGEIVTLTRMLGEGEDLARARAREAAWMRDVWAAQGRMPAWWHAMPAIVGRRWREERLARQGLFDAGAYRAAYRDVAEAGLDPLGHYIAHGMAEGRKPMVEDRT